MRAETRRHRHLIETMCVEPLQYCLFRQIMIRSQSVVQESGRTGRSVCALKWKLAELE